MRETERPCTLSALLSMAVAFSACTCTASFYHRLVATLPFVRSPRICRAEVIAAPKAHSK